MASVFHLFNDAFHIKQQIVNRYADFAEDNKNLFFAATMIQRNWRGYWVRKTIKKWNASAVIIQKFARGFFVRWQLPEMFEEQLEYMSRKYYNRAATKIQALWRGYRIRTKLSIKQILEERARLSEISKEMREQLASLFEKLRQEQFDQEKLRKHFAMRNCLEAVFDRHHLLRTKHREGVLSIHGSDELSEIEQMLKSLPLKNYMKKVRKLSKKPHESTDDEMFFGKQPFDIITKMRPKAYERMLMTQNSNAEM